MRYSEEKGKDIHIVRIRENKLTSHEAPEMKKSFLEILSDSGEIILMNMAEVEYMDSTGLGSLLFGVRQAENMDKEVVFCELSPRIQSLVRIAHLNDVLEIYDTEAEAVKEIMDDLESMS